jgi:hypothetical protein
MAYNTSSVIGNTVGTYANRPSAGTKGRIYICSDGAPIIFVDDGANWRPLIDGTFGTESATGNSLAAYTQRNFLSSTAASASGGCAILNVFNNGTGPNNLQGIDVSYTTTKAIVVCLKPWVTPSSTAQFVFGAYIYDSVGGTAEAVCLDCNSTNPAQIDQISWSDLNTVGSAPGNRTYSGSNERIWFRLKFNGGTTLQYDYSTDGVNFVTTGTKATATSFNRAGVFADARSTSGTVVVNLTVESFLVA